MLRILMIVILLVTNILASEIKYSAKLEPVDILVVKSQVNGRVEIVKKELESKESNGEIIIKIDDYQEKINLENAKSKLSSLNLILKNIEKSITNTEKIISLKSSILDKMKNLKSKSDYEKDLEEIGIKNTQNSYFSLLIQKDQTKIQIEDLKANIKLLEDTIKNKNIKIDKNLYIYEISIKKDDYATIGRELLKVADLSKAKITIFLSKEELENINDKTIYIDNQKTNLKIEKIWRVSDSINISSYKAEILLNSPKFFSKVVEIVFK